jgi:hypothetical protein
MSEYTLAHEEEPDSEESDGEESGSEESDSEEEETQSQRLKRSKVQNKAALDLAFLDAPPVMRVNQKYLFIVDTLLTCMQDAMGRASDHVNESPKISLRRFHTWLFEEMHQASESAIVTARNRWMEYLMVSEAHIRIFRLLHGMNRDGNMRHIILLKDEALLQPGMSGFTDIETPDIRRPKEHKMWSTDAVFTYLMGLADSAFFNTILWSDILVDHGVCKIKTEYAEMPDGIYIFRDRVRNRWIYQVSNAERWSADSFTHAFFQLRKLMRERSISPIVRRIDVSIFDKRHFTKQ